MNGFPVRPDAVTAEWLSDVFDTRVAIFRQEPVGTGQVGDSVRYYLEGEGAPPSLVGKFAAADPTSRATATIFGLYRKEVEFYRRAAASLDVRVPNVYHAEVSEDGADFLLLFEDMGPARQGDQIAGCGLDDAKAAIRQAAGIHALSWKNCEILDAAWIQPPGDLAARIAALYPQAQSTFRERYSATLEEEYMTLCDRLAERSERYFDRPAEPICLIHGDFRLDNMLFDIRGGREPIAILDWQTVSTGNPMTDVGYFLGCGIGSLGLAHEDELLDLYIEEMRGKGVDLTRQEIAGDYRRGILHGVSTAVFSSAFVERTERGDENFLSMARGACALALKHDSIAALEEA